MTKNEFITKYNQIINWGIKETDKITKKLKKQGKIHGLDTNTKEYEPIHKEIKVKINKLKEKYEASTNK